jgi:hypothetical protein
MMQISSAEASALKTRRLAFELGLSDLRVQGALIARSSPGRSIDLAVCPCCGYPTLSARGMFDICCLCGWEDDGQDDRNADAVRGGPNSDYSLTEARRNFIDYRTQYRPADTGRFEREMPTRAVRTELIAVFDALLPIVHPWTFIAALPDIERLERTIYEIKFGKKPRSIVPRDPSVVKREQEYHMWNVWELLARTTLAPWRHSIFDEVPPIEQDKDRAFDAFARAVDARLREIVGERGGTAPERLSCFRATTEWVRDEREARLSQFVGHASIGLAFWPAPDDATVYYRYDDADATGDAAERIACYFGMPLLRALPGRDATYSGGLAIT